LCFHASPTTVRSPLSLHDALPISRSGLVPVSDPSNENERFDRVKARKIAEHLAPLGLDAARLARMAGHMARAREALEGAVADLLDRKSTRLNSSHVKISYAVFCLK